MSSNKPTLLEQYQAIKRKHKNHLLFFRLGDFYELFGQDAEVVSRELQLTLTKRDFSKENTMPMCGVPFHSADPYIKKLVERGYKVAICEQMEDAADKKSHKELISREVIRVVTPGTITDGNMLDSGKNNYICSLYISGNRFGIVFADISTGTVYATQKEKEDISAGIIDEFDRFMPAEILFNDAFVDLTKVAKYLKNNLRCTAELIDDSEYDSERAKEVIQKQFDRQAESCGIYDFSLTCFALGALLEYLHKTQKEGSHRLIDLTIYSDDQYMTLDMTARRNLELTQTIRTEEKRGSLLGVLDRTKTAMGKRLMRQCIEQPLANPAKILRRQDAIAELIKQYVVCQNIVLILNSIFDLERLMTRVVYRSVTPRELKSLSYTAGHIPKLKSLMSKFKSPLLQEINQNIGDMEDIHRLIENAIVDDPPSIIKDGGFIKEGFNQELDELRGIRENGRSILVEMEEKEKQKTGIKKLKIGYNRVFGYYIEVTNPYKDQVPPHYLRKQTLANCERYITEELKQYEHKILVSHERALLLEAKIFEDLRRYVAERLGSIQETAGAVAMLDVLCSFASVSQRNRYVRPEIIDTGEIIIKDGRHPVVETTSELPFVANDTKLDMKQNLLALITGPNMAGKSTYMRQVALIVLMAQIGCFVPAASAKISLVDKIFTRIGASDDLSAGQSTFMVEMSEVANILQNATPRSLILLDEIGRGTSTFDGMSIAQAVVEYIVNTSKIRAKTLFATHYHELTTMQDEIPCIQNYNIAVRKRGDDIIFLRKIVKGATDDSYGIAVAKLAGIPGKVIKRANEILEKLEANRGIPPKEKKAEEEQEDAIQIRLDDGKEAAMVQKMQDISWETLTPLEAMNMLVELKNLAE